MCLVINCLLSNTRNCIFKIIPALVTVAIAIIKHYDQKQLGHRGGEGLFLVRPMQAVVFPSLGSWHSQKGTDQEISPGVESLGPLSSVVELW